MSDKIEYSRLIQKRFSQPGVVPTIPASGATTLSQLVYTDLLIGEIAFNLPDKRMWFRAETEIVEIFGVSGGTYANLFIEGDSDTSINSIANNDSGGLNVGEYNFTVGENNSTFADNSAVIAGFDNIINVDSDNSAIIGGSGNIISGATNVIMLGCENTDAFQSGSTYVQNLVITDLPTTGNTNTDLILLRGVNGAVTAIPVSDLPSGGAQNLLQVLQTGDYAAYGDTAYYLGQDGFLVDGTSTDQKSYLIDHNAFYTQISRSDDLNPSDGSTILLDSNGIRLESNSDVIFGANVVNNKITYDGQTMDVDNVNDYIASATTNSFMPKSYIDSLSATTYTFDNGLTESGGTVKLGGTLTDAATSINADGNFLQILNASTFNLGNLTTFQVNTDVNNNILRLNENDLLVQIDGQSSIYLDSTTLTLDNLNTLTVNSNLIVENTGLKVVSAAGFSHQSLNPDAAQRGIRNDIDYSTGWTVSTPDSILATKGYVDRATSGSTPSGPVTSYNQFPSGFDNNAFYDDGFLEFSWNAPAGRPEIKMLVEPSGSGDMRSLAIRSDGTSQNTFITQPNLTYSLFTPGVTSGDKCTITIGAEDDPTFPFYNVTVYNLGSSFNTSFIIEKIN